MNKKTKHTKSLLIALTLSLTFLQTHAQQKFSPDAKSYFKEVAFGSEYGNTKDTRLKKWTKDIQIFIPSTCPDYLRVELGKIISELNALIKPIQIYNTTQKSKANLKVYACNANDYIKSEPRARRLVAGNLGLFYIYPNAKGEIQNGSVFLNIQKLKAKDTQRHILREELTQALGLMRDSERYKDSIFYQKWSRVNKFSELDKEVIRILYSPKLKAGLTLDKAKNILKEL